MLFNLPVGVLPFGGVLSWVAFHALVISGFLVVPGVMLAMYRRMADTGAVAVQRFAWDLLPLVLLYLVSVSGLLLWVSYEWLHGYFYGALAHFHALTVIGTLIYFPFGKLFHVFQRPASLGVALYEGAAARGEKARCPVTGEEFASSMQVADLGKVLPEVGFDYAARETTRASWTAVSPTGRRMLIARAHSATRRGRFS
jgi:hypothetical protein